MFRIQRSINDHGKTSKWIITDNYRVIMSILDSHMADHEILYYVDIRVLKTNSTYDVSGQGTSYIGFKEAFADARHSINMHYFKKL